MSTTTKRLGKGWWLFAAIALLIFIVLQLPAAWLMARLSPNNPYIDHVTGNIWKGQADWHVQEVQGVLSWKLRPWELILLRIGADVDVSVSDSQLSGQVAVGRQSWQIKQLNGQVSAHTLRSVMPWQWPDSPIRISNLGLKFSQDKGFDQIDGQLNWGGGTLGYPFEGRIQRAALPPLVGRLGLNRERLHLAMTDSNNARMGDIYVSADQMLDVQLTQRLLQTVAGYRGQAGLDTAVVTTRQPLSSLRGL
ncbi:MAG: type II secretion system protein N [Pseudomonadota bacterium]|nr:type II secretion system protein N [Pseudomonadota bacterium]